MKDESVAFLWCALALTDLRLKLLPHRFNRKFLSADITYLMKNDLSSEQALCGGDAKEKILRLSELVRRASRHRFIFNMSCLRQALVLRSRLKARGLPARLVYGARKDDEKFLAHAWVEVSGLRLDSGPDHLFHMFES